MSRRRLSTSRYRWGPSLTVGGGMDYDLPFFDTGFGLRLFQADYRYMHADYGPAVNPPTGWRTGRTREPRRG